jgi:uncharacterized protein
LADNDHTDIVRLLLQARANINLVDAVGYTPIHYAVSAELVEIATLLISNPGASVSISAGSHRQTPLHLAVAIDDEHWLEAGFPIVRALLKAKAHVNIQDSQKRSALHYAVERERWDAVQLLIAASCDTNITDVEGETALHWASKHRYACARELSEPAGWLQ